MKYQRPYRHHSNQRLLAELMQSSGAEKRCLVRVLLLLAEVESRGLHLELGYSSLFGYCVEELRLSEDQAYLRVRGARVGRRFPVVFEMLERGELSLTVVAKLKEHLTPENHRELLAA